MLSFGVTIPATVPQRSEIPEGLMKNPVYWELSECSEVTQVNFAMCHWLHSSWEQVPSLFPHFYLFCLPLMHLQPRWHWFYSWKTTEKYVFLPFSALQIFEDSILFFLKFKQNVVQSYCCSKCAGFQVSQNRKRNSTCVYLRRHYTVITCATALFQAGLYSVCI